MTAHCEHRHPVNRHNKILANNWDDGMILENVRWKIGTVSTASARTAVTSSLPTSLGEPIELGSDHHPRKGHYNEHDKDTISMLSMGSATIPATRSTTKTNDHPIPALICFLGKPLLSEPPQDTTPTRSVLIRRRQTLGSTIHPYAIGDIVGQSVPLHHMIMTAHHHDDDDDATAVATGAEKDEDALTRQSHHHHHHHIAGNMLHVLHVTWWRPLQQIFQTQPPRGRRSTDGFLLRPARNGYLA
eukprot:scaffold1924_cov218-Amphora_coffeaeformis.AAC.11